jgi:amino acid adenylation domain-containing protein
MNIPPAAGAALPTEQLAIRARCAHPTAAFVPFEPADAERPLPARFAQMVARHGEGVAVLTDAGALTYDALNRLANRIAHAVLRERGPGPEPIAVLRATDAGMIAALLGIIKAGKLCVPLAPSWPGARIDAVLADAEAPLLLTHGVGLAAGARAECEVVDLDALDPELPASDPGLSLAPDDLAYIVYTSGSTGLPKGVVQNHRNTLHEAMLYANALRLCAADRLALLYPCHASQGLKITFAALLNGAVLCPFDLPRRGLDELTPWLARHAVTVYFSVPAVFREWTASFAAPPALPALRIIQLGSDSVTRGDLDAYRARWPVAPPTLVVRLGSTETGSLAICFFDGVRPAAEDLVPVGYPVDGVEITLRGQDGRAAAPDASGEIVVRSRYLSLGYWRQPGLTRTRFVADPGDAGATSYLTGDLARRRADGCLYHLGRKDLQVKISGNLVEVAEVEAALRACGPVKEAVVAAHDHDGGTRLVAYVVAAPGATLSGAELRAALAARLPEFMLPSRFVPLAALPLTPSGKVDRRALASPRGRRPALDVAMVAPRTGTEETLASIWAEVLGLDVDQVGVEDPFLDLGGHSLDAIRILSRVIERLGVDLPVEALLEARTVADLADVVDRRHPRRR